MGKIVYMESKVKVICQGTAEARHKVRLARYEWSANEGVWERIDRHGSDDDWYLRADKDGMRAYPRPTFECPVCQESRVFAHDSLQARLQQAAEHDGTLVI